MHDAVFLSELQAWMRRLQKQKFCAKIRVLVKRILNKFGYPPDMQEEATQLVLKQAEVLCEEWALLYAALGLHDAVFRSELQAWTRRLQKQKFRTGIRILVKRILNKFGYPPDMQEEATQLVLKQAEVLCEEWALS